MEHESTDSHVKGLWQQQLLQGSRMSREQLARRSAEFDRRILRRNALEYGAAAVVVAFLAVRVWFETDWVVRLAGLLLMAGAGVMAYQLHRRTSVQRMPTDLALEDCISFHRRVLERQRDALRSVWLWYLLPATPGVVLLLAAQRSARPLAVRLAALAAVAAFVLFVNGRAAGQLERAIDELDKSVE
ncbi:MAG: hypothetical protein ABL982_11570 [Vicinamibacterales bacterium]